MLKFSDPITEIVRRRFSCRDYRREPVSAKKREQLQAFIEALPPGSFSARPRFYLQRTPGYRKDLIKHILDLCDLQRLDMGIAMCHFELTVNELGLRGKWVVEDEIDNHPDALTEYIVSWESRS